MHSVIIEFIKLVGENEIKKKCKEEPKSSCFEQCRRSLVKSAYQKITFLISQPKHVLWVLKRTFSMRRFFRAPNSYVQTDGLENIYNFTLKYFVYLNL